MKAMFAYLGRRKQCSVHALTEEEGATVWANSLLYVLVPKWDVWSRFVEAAGCTRGFFELETSMTEVALAKAFHRVVTDLEEEGVHAWGDWPYRTLTFAQMTQSK